MLSGYWISPASGPSSSGYHHITEECNGYVSIYIRTVENFQSNQIFGTTSNNLSEKFLYFA